LKRTWLVVLALLLCGTVIAQADGASESNVGYADLLADGVTRESLPRWIVSVEHNGGVFESQPAKWVIDETTPAGEGKLIITIDREKLVSDVGMTLICDGRDSADMVVQLLDDENRVVVVDLVGNAISLSEEMFTDTFAIPLMDHSSGTKIVLQRLSGSIAISRIVLFPLVIGLSDTPDLLTQIDMLKLLKQTLSPESRTYKAIVAAAGSATSGVPDEEAVGEPEPWYRDWEILATGNEPNIHLWGHHEFGWLPSALPPFRFLNRPHYDDTDVRTGFIALHPVSQTEPARIRYKYAVPMDRPILTVTASGNANGNGDCLLQCVVNGDVIKTYVLDASKWHTCEFDLSGYAGQSADLVLLNAPGGERDWWFEHCYIDNTQFEQTASDHDE